MPEKQHRHLKQPRVFPLAVATSLFERYGFYVLAMLLVLYTKSQFGLSDKQSYVLYGVFNALVFITPAAGGWLADNLIGIKRAMLLGLFCEGVGLTLASFPSKHLFLFGLSFVIIGVGFFKTAPTNLMGRAYSDKDPRIDSGFTLYYMTMNMGSFFSPIVAGLLQHSFGWIVAFLFGAAVIFANIFVYFLLRHRADNLGVEAGKRALTKKLAFLIVLGIIAAAALSIVLLNFPLAAHIFFFFATAILLIYFFYEIANSPKKERFEIIACLSLILIGMVFFIMYFQYYMSVTLFIKRCIRHHVFGVYIPTEAFLSLNAFWIVVLSPIMVWLYNFLRRTRGKDMPVTTKFPLGLLIITLCFFILTLGCHFYDANFKISSFWLILAVMVYSVGELLISALGVAMVTHIAPKRMYGVMMGAWFLIAAALASSLSSSVAGLASIPAVMHDPHTILNIYSKAFFDIAIGGAIATIAAFIVSPYIKRIANLD